MHDALVTALCSRTRLRLVLADVTESARANEIRHQAGPTAGCVLAEGLTAVALLSSDAAQAEEAISIGLRVDGPVQGLMVEACGNGNLRGFPHIKALNALDGAAEIATGPALGAAGSVAVVRSLPGRILNQTMLQLNPPRLETLVARFCNQSMQVPTAACIVVRSDVAGVLFARGLIAARMPDSDGAAFLRVLEAFNAGQVAARLAETERLEDFGEVLGGLDLAIRERRELRFQCRCSREKMAAVVLGLPADDLNAMLAEGGDHRVTCHMCGQTHTLTTDELRALIKAGRAAVETGPEGSAS